MMIQGHMPLNSLPNDKILDSCKFKTFADDKINIIQKLKFAMGREKNIVGKGLSAFSHFPQCFQKTSFSGSLKLGKVC